MGHVFAQMPNYVKFMTEIISNKKKLEAYGTINLIENCRSSSGSSQRNSKDLGSFTIPCIIGKHTFNKALCDLGANINLIPFSVAKRLNLGEITPTAL